MKAIFVAVCVVTMTVLVTLVAAAACGEPDTPATPTAAPRATIDAPASSSGSGLSDMARAGESAFNANCSTCHGVGAVGTRQGPSLLDRVYHPGHHPDASFRNAVRNGVPSHHWPFGDMAPVPGVSTAEIEQVICYVRETQRASGLFEAGVYSTVC